MGYGENGERCHWWARPERCDPDEPLVMPFWLVLTASNLARAARKLTRDSPAEDTRIQVTLASAARGDPREWLPGAYPPSWGDGEQLGRYWQEIADELSRCLPDPFAHRQSQGGGGG